MFAREQAALWAESRGARLDALLKRAVANGEVQRVCRGLYCLADRYLHGRVNALTLAQRIHGPSYISLETALAQHGWIPEGVPAVTSASVRRSREFDTPLGLFSFTRVPQRRFLAGVRRSTAAAAEAFLMATPLKALADLVYVQRRDWDSAIPVTESLRVEPESLAELSTELFDEVMDAYGPGLVMCFLEGLRKDLGL